MKPVISLACIRYTALAVISTSVAVSQTPVRDRMPEEPIDAPQLFVPGQTPNPSVTSSMVIPSPPPEASPLQPTERNFMGSLISANQRELRLALNAAARTKDPAVKALAQSIIAESRETAKSLTALHRAQGGGNTVAVNESTIADARLNTLSGAELDAALMRELQRVREAKISRFEAAQRNGGNTELLSYLNATLPQLRTQTRTGFPPLAASATLPGALSGTLSNPAGGSLPNVSGGALPSVTPGTLPNPAGGALPNVSGGALPSVTPGRLPNPAGGALPPVTPGTTPPNLNPPAVPPLPGPANPVVRPAARPGAGAPTAPPTVAPAKTKL